MDTVINENEDAMSGVDVCDEAMDIVSRQAVMDCIDKYSRMIIRPIKFKACINALPPVIPARKKGRWLEYRSDMYICSKCGYIYTDLSGEKYGMNFCPNCGDEKEEMSEWEKMST